MEIVHRSFCMSVLLTSLLLHGVQFSVAANIHKRVLTEDEAQLSGARALDGTPYVYYVSDFDESGPHDWIVYLQGGGECLTYEDCVDRAGIGGQGSSDDTWLTSTLDPNTRSVSEGMTSKDPEVNPDFYTFGTLFLPYLSGDDWLGQQRVACVPWGAAQNCSGMSETHLQPLFFAGHNNFVAAITYWLSSLIVKPRSVLLTGASAGGQGAFHHADLLADMLPGVAVKANPQYGWFGAPTDTFPDWERGATTQGSKPYPSSGSPVAAPPWMYNISTFFPTHCLETLNMGESPYLCTSTPRVALTVRAPLFVSTNLFDGFLTSVMEKVPSGELGPTVAIDSKLRYLMKVTAPSMRDSVRNATSLQLHASNGAFVPACIAHSMEWSGEFAPILGVRMCTHSAAVASWFFGRNDCERYLIAGEETPALLAKISCNRGKFVAGVVDGLSGSPPFSLLMPAGALVVLFLCAACYRS